MSVGTSERTRLVDVLASFAAAGEIGGGQPPGHLARVCWLSLAIGRQMGLPDEGLADLYCTSLLVHTGCTAGAREFAAFLMSDELVAQRDVCLCDPDHTADVLRFLASHLAPDRSRLARTGLFARALLDAEKTMGEVERGCSDVGARIATRLDMPADVRAGLYNICESWNGKGPRHLKGDAIPTPARVVHTAMLLEVLLTELGEDGAREAAAKRRGKSMSPDVVDAFIEVSLQPMFSARLQAEGSWQWVRDNEPTTRARFLSEDDLDGAALALADFGDLKSPGFAAHSRATADLATALAGRLGLAEADVTLARRAALVHAVGQAGVPAQILSASGSLSIEDEERLRRHPSLGERVVERTPGLAEAGRIAAMHHERLDGGGYPRGLAASAIPMTARIVALADAFREAVEGRGEQGPIEPEQVLAGIRPLAGPGFDRDCFAALEAEIAGRPPSAAPRVPWPAGLTDREVEVLRLLGRGMKKREIAAELVVAESTVRHHLEHIYTKIDVTSTAGAILFAVENALLP